MSLLAEAFTLVRADDAARNAERAERDRAEGTYYATYLADATGIAFTYRETTTVPTVRSVRGTVFTQDVRRHLIWVGEDREVSIGILPSRVDFTVKRDHPEYVVLGTCPSCYSVEPYRFSLPAGVLSTEDAREGFLRAIGRALSDREPCGTCRHAPCPSCGHPS